MACLEVTRTSPNNPMLPQVLWSRIMQSADLRARFAAPSHPRTSRSNPRSEAQTATDPFERSDARPAGLTRLNRRPFAERLRSLRGGSSRPKRHARPGPRHRRAGDDDAWAQAAHHSYRSAHGPLSGNLTSSRWPESARKAIASLRESYAFFSPSSPLRRGQSPFGDVEPTGSAAPVPNHGTNYPAKRGCYWTVSNALGKSRVSIITWSRIATRHLHRGRSHFCPHRLGSLCFGSRPVSGL